MTSTGIQQWLPGSSNASHMLAATAVLLPDRIAVADPDGSASFKDLWNAAQGVAELIRANGIRAGERVGLMFERGTLSAAAYFGALASGAIAVPINEALKTQQIDYIVRHSSARLLLTSEALSARLQPLTSNVPVVALSGLPSAERTFVAPRTGADVAHLIYTSGSTGMPKGVVVSHANVWAGVDSVVAYLSIDQHDRIASLLPFSFDYGLNQLLCAAKTGATLVVERSPVPQRIVETLHRESITVLPAVPPLWLQLLTAKRFSEEALPSLRVMTNTGGRVPTEAVRRLRACQPHADLVLMYGLTEAFRSTYLDPRKVDRKPDSIGQAIPGAEILVLRDDLTPCAPNEVGQLVHRGPTVTLGYWNNPEATAERLRPNPLRPEGTPDVERVVFSGDLVRLDEEGDIYFVGRRDTLIKSLGHRVSPDEVADALYASGEIVEAVVTAEPDEMRGDAIIAYVVLTATGSLDNLKRYAARELPRYMQPVHYRIRESLARTSSGKHDAKAMAETVDGA